ncbi:MAG TPA: dephospho-CoA kinase [Gammaproteobacteria bacterium]|nr:dephospho-CoA kinase [Gammaproteobacteria bacterium]
MKRQLIVGLTGGIASGKSAVSRCFEQLGVPVIDADAVAREVVEPGETALEAIVKKFGREVLEETGRLDRKTLRELVFARPELRRELEKLLHPEIRRRMQEKVAELNHDYVVLVIPLLLEVEQTDLVDRVLVVDAPESLQIARAVERDRSSEKEIRDIMSAQLPREERLARADDVIENRGSLRDLSERVGKLDRFYRTIARSVAARGQ